MSGRRCAGEPSAPHPHLRVERSPAGYRRLLLSRPQRHNALDVGLARALRDAFAEDLPEPVVLGSTDPRMFCAGADLTVAVRRYEMQVPYGVIDCDGPQVRGLREKPDFAFFVNAGIYLLEPSVFDFIPVNQHLNMTDLISSLLAAGRPVISFPICEYWLDIGQQEHYRQAQEHVQTKEICR